MRQFTTNNSNYINRDLHHNTQKVTLDWLLFQKSSGAKQKITECLQFVNHHIHTLHNIKLISPH